MATYNELKGALVTAHRAGDTRAAQLFADKLKSGQYREAQQAQMPTAAESVSGPQAALIGAGRAFTRLGRGAADLAARGAGLQGAVEGLRAAEESEAPGYQALQEERPWSTLAGEVAPYLAAAPLSGGGSLLGTAASGAGMSALEYQPELEDRATAGLLGGAAGGAGHALGRTVGRLIGGRVSQLDEATESLARRGEDLGFQLSPAKRTGSKALEQVESRMGRRPLTSAPFTQLKQDNQRALNRVASKALGLGELDAIPDVKLGEAADAIGRQFDDALRGQSVALDDTFLSSLDDIEQGYRSVWGRNSKIPGIVEDARKEATGSGRISAERYQQLQSRLREDAQSIMRSQAQDPGLGRAVGEVKDALDDAAERSLSGERLISLKDARAKWKVLRQLDPKTGAAALDPVTGDVSGRKLASTLAKRDVSGFRRGKTGSDLYDAARFSRAFADQIGDSGTPTGLVDYLGEAWRGGGAGSLLGLAVPFVDPTMGAAIGAASPLLPYAGSRIYASQLAQRGLLPLGEAAQRGAGRYAGSLLAGASGTGAR